MALHAATPPTAPFGEQILSIAVEVFAALFHSPHQHLFSLRLRAWDLIKLVVERRSGIDAAHERVLKLKVLIATHEDAQHGPNDA